MGFLKENMISEMRLRNYSDRTIETYTIAVHKLAQFFNTPPTLLSRTDVKEYLLHLLDSGASPSKRYAAYYGIKLFYDIHHMAYILSDIPAPKRPFVIPPVLDQKEIQEILMNCTTLRYRTIFSIIYSAGLRIGEAMNLKTTDIDFSRRIIIINSSKNNKSRLTILSEKMIALLKKYINRYQPQDYLFFKKHDRAKPLNSSQVRNVFMRIIKQCGLNKKAHVHTLRHSFATHLLENNTNIYYIMKLLGHSSIKSTLIYLHMQRLDFQRIRSPLDTSSISLSKNIELKDNQYPLLSA